MKVSVERYVQQVHDGSHYNGYVKIADTKFDYELRFSVPIPRIDGMEPAKDADEVRRILQLTVKKSGANIELTNKEYGFFLEMLLQFVVQFYRLPQTRDSNEGFLGMTMRGEGLASDIGVSASIGVTSSGSCDFPPKLCEMLNTPKFGCALTV